MDQETQQEFEKLAVTIKKGFDEVDARFDKVDERFDRVEGRLDKVEGRLGTLETKVNNLDGRIKSLPDRDFLTAKLADLKGDLVVLARKQDEKTNLLIDMLSRKQVLTPGEVDALRAIEVFPAPRVSAAPI